MLILDGHNDTLLNLYLEERGGGRSFFEPSDRGHIDLTRARQAGFGGGFFAVFVPSDPPFSRARDLVITDTGYEAPLAAPVELARAQQFAIALSSLLFRLEHQSAGQLSIVTTAAGLETCLQSGVLAAILHFEGAEAIDPDLNALELFYRAGLRSLGIVWSRPNAFACGVPFTYPHTPDIGPGLTDAGRELVRACNHLGIMLDLSHLNERGFWEVAGLSSTPLVATHSNAHTLCPVTRNLTDRQLDAIKESDGMVGVAFDVSMLRADGHLNTDTPLTAIVRHLTYLVDRLGIDHVGFGSDFDGCTVPDDLHDVTGLPRLLDALRAAGYDEPSLGKLTHQNWQRVLQQTWRG
jgi:membrane dipeptidase